jgi:hypothetical protein
MFTLQFKYFKLTGFKAIPIYSYFNLSKWCFNQQQKSSFQKIFQIYRVEHVQIYLKQ